MSIRERRQIQLPLTPTHWPVLDAYFPFPQSEWDKLVELLELMRPNIVVPDGPTEKQTGERGG